MHFSRNCDCLHASFGSSSGVFLAEAILAEAGIWCRLDPGEGCGMLLTVRKEDRARVEALLSQKGYLPEKIIQQ